MTLHSLALFVCLAVPAAPSSPTPADPTANVAADEQALKAANVDVSPQALVDFFRKRTPSTENDAAVAALIKQLADKDPAGHAKATGGLVALGPAAIKPLRAAANDIKDTDAGDRARKTLALIEGQAGAQLVAAAARLVGAHKPDGAAQALIDYYPFADDEGVARDVEAALARVALAKGKPDPALVQALKDESPARRSAAAVALCQAGGISVHDRVRPLLKDPKPTVRFQVALALANAHDAEVVPTLIDVLGDLPSAQRKQAEEWLTDLAGEWAIKVPQGNDATSRRLRRELWLAWWTSLDGKQLADEFKSRTLGDDDHDKVIGLIKKLDDPAAEAREKASQDLVAVGPKAVPLLRQAAQHENPRVTAMAQKCVELIEKDAPNPLPSTAARLLALRRPEGALETLLAYLPFAENETAAAEIRDLLVALGSREGKADPVIVKALEDKVGARRGAAAYVLCRAESAEHYAAVRKLLGDPEPEVRLQTAEALLSIRQREAVPVLIALLGDLTPQRAWEVEDYLSRLADGKGPTVPLGTDANGRAKCRDAWAAWWKDQGPSIDLAKVDAARHQLGLTLLVETYDPNTRAGRVVEVDRTGKVRWKIEGLQGPMDAQVLPGQRVLIAEQNVNRVTERDLAGKVVWEKGGVPQPFVAQRLANGNTFVGCRNSLQEFDRDGKQVYAVQRVNEYLMAATKFRDGTIAYVNNAGRYVRIDNTGKEVKSYNIPFNPQFGFNVAEILPNDHVIISVQGAGKVAEYSPDGKMVWEAAVQHNGVPYRLPNGNTLVPNAGAMKITELDRAGKVVSEMDKLPARPWRVSRR
jgi:HEAT repeat protein